MQFLTNFADQAVILPVAAATALVLAATRWWRGLGAWIVAVGGVLAVILLLKLVFAACAGLGGDTGIRSPSGHTASAAVVYGGVLILTLRNRLPPAWLAALPLLMAALFGATRLILHVHTPGDVVAGGLIGMAGAAALAWMAGPRPQVRAWPMALAVCAVMATLHGLQLPAEAAIRHFALSDWLNWPASCRA